MGPTAPASAPAVAEPARASEDPLEQHFSGKRAAERIFCVRPVEIEGTEGRVPARVHDLSDGGFLVEILGEDFVAAVDAGRVEDCLDLIGQQFGGGLRVWFPDAAGHALPIVLDAEVVRVTIGPDPKDGVRAGCRLLRAPSAVERRLVGIAPAYDRRRGWIARNGRPPHALLYATKGTTLGPLCAVKLLAVDGRRLSLRVDGAAPDVASRFGAPTVRIGVVRKGRLAWDAPARLVEVRRDASAPGSLAVEIEAELPVPHEVLKHFRRLSSRRGDPG